jgi:hypothetical protein
LVFVSREAADDDKNKEHPRRRRLNCDRALERGIQLGRNLQNGRRGFVDHFGDSG